jgi:hypothetical protein
MNPTASLGWGGDERMSLADPGPTHVAMALALIHHLAISNNVPLSRIAEYLDRSAAYSPSSSSPRPTPRSRACFERVRTSSPSVRSRDSKRPSQHASRSASERRSATPSESSSVSSAADRHGHAARGFTRTLVEYRLSGPGSDCARCDPASLRSRRLDVGGKDHATELAYCTMSSHAAAGT